MLYSVTRYGIEIQCLPFIDGFVWPCMALYGLVWPYVAPYGLIAYHRHGLVWPSVFLYGILGPFYGFLSHFMVFYCRISSFLAVIDPNSFRLVFQKFSMLKSSKWTVSTALKINCNMFSNLVCKLIFVEAYLSKDKQEVAAFLYPLRTWAEVKTCPIIMNFVP